MAVTITAFNNLLKQLTTDLPDIKFAPGDDFRWSSSTKTVYFNPNDNLNASRLLHEVAHGVLGHDSYIYDIDLLKLEDEAWNKAIRLGKIYGVNIEHQTVEDALDSYRDWLHARSTCPKCNQNGLQNTENSYRCLVCNQNWQVNDARACNLRRAKL